MNLSNFTSNELQANLNAVATRLTDLRYSVEAMKKYNLSHKPGHSKKYAEKLQEIEALEKWAVHLLTAIGDVAVKEYVKQN